jgi:hypothetical protein
VIAVTGMEGGVTFSTRYPKTVWKLRIDEGEQVWGQLEVGSQSRGTWPTVTGGIFEFGFPDAILAMLASYFAERAGVLGARFACATPAEAVASHRIVDAAMRSWDVGGAVSTTRGG